MSASDSVLHGGAGGVGLSGKWCDVRRVEYPKGIPPMVNHGGRLTMPFRFATRGAMPFGYCTLQKRLQLHLKSA